MVFKNKCKAIEADTIYIFRRIKQKQLDLLLVIYLLNGESS